MTKKHPEKIAILGGGLGSLTAAFELTSEAGWKNKYDITVYQTGWRLGGKMSGGRGPGERIEEFGLHIFMGFYSNAHQMFRQTYRELIENRLSPGLPFQSFEDALLPNNSLLFLEYLPWKKKWVKWPLIIPLRSGFPGDGPVPLEDKIKTFAGIFLQFLFGSPYSKTKPFFIRYLLKGFYEEKTSSLIHLIAFCVKITQAIVNQTKRTFRLIIPKQSIKNLKVSRIAGTTRKISNKRPPRSKSNFKNLFGEKTANMVKWNNTLRRIYILINLAGSIKRGAKKDLYDPVSKTYDYNKINHLDFREWLKMHGASQLTLSSVLVQFFYNAPFNNLINNNLKGGALAAGTALMFLIQGENYRGSIFYQLKAGTADTLIMPLYQVLQNRGVKFKFFHKVRSIHSSHENSNSISKITIDRQVRLKNGNRLYDPIIKTKSKIPAWSSHPDFNQIDPAQVKKIKELHEKGETLESPWSKWDESEEIYLRLGKDFDRIIMGIPVCAQKEICKHLVENDPDKKRKKRWSDMINKIVSTQVMSAQLWVDKTLEEMGFQQSKWGLNKKHNQLNVVTYAYPVFSILDQSQFLSYENHSKNSRAKSVLAFTNALHDPVDIPDYQYSNFNREHYIRVKEVMRQWLWDHSGWLFPLAVSPGAPQGLNWDILNSGDKNLNSREKFDGQFFMASLNPSDRYISAAPGTGAYRMKPDKSGYDNLFLVGDWTDFGANFGYMEGTVISSIKAVSALKKTIAP